MPNPIILKKGLKLGELNAEADGDLLKACFLNNGTLDRLMSVEDHAAIILGRTGSGKSALLLQVKEKSEHSCLLNPHNISVRFLEYSNIIQFLSELEIKLDLFYRILWRHILIVELLKLRYNLHNEKDSKGLLSNLWDFVSKDRVKRKAFEYFSEWGNKFWLEVDEQFKELTEKFTKDIKSQLGTKFSEIDISLDGAKSLSNEQRVEIKPRVSKAVSEIQIQKLNEVFNLLSEYSFVDKQKKYYILIDQLDEEWAETEIRYRFIRALIEEIRSFRALPQVKVLVALRQDLLEIVFDHTRDAGFQEEKYDAYLLPLKWTAQELEQLVELRVNEVFKRQYTKNNIKFSDIFPSKKDGGCETPIKYIISRTLLRPRDVLQYTNECLNAASGREKVTWKIIYSTEAIYSVKRLKSLQEEWDDIYPAFKETVNILRGLQDTFTRKDIGGERIANICISLDDLDAQDSCVKACKRFYDPVSSINESEVISELLMCFYHIGIIGIKISKLESFVWTYVNQPRVSKSEIKRANQIQIHKMIHHALDIQVQNKKN
jgi:hypothetical protein